MHGKSKKKKNPAVKTFSLFFRVTTRDSQLVEKDDLFSLFLFIAFSRFFATTANNVAVRIPSGWKASTKPAHVNPSDPKYFGYINKV